MSLFERFFRRNQNSAPQPMQQGKNEQNEADARNASNNDYSITTIKGEEKHGVEAIYAFLNRDYEPTGYDDACLRNEDRSYKDSNIKHIKMTFLVTIDKEINRLEKHILDLDCEIVIRKDAGLADLVRVLENRKEKATKDLDKINEIKQDVLNDKGLFLKVLLSYERGFNRGLVAVSLERFNIKSNGYQ